MYKALDGILLMLFVIPLCHSCPLPCVCKWKNGKQTVECTNKGLLVIPDGMDPSTQVLDASGNNFRTLHHAKFLKMDLINLQRIYLSRNHIFSIDNETFKGLANLVELDLSHNSLQAVPSAAFLRCPALMRLTLNGNPIKALRRAVFSHLSSLSSLELSNCEISTVDEAAFQGLYSLEWLYLDGNKMSSFAAARNLPRLKGVQLHENPWECDCNILELHGWLLAFSFPLSVEPVCKGPSRLSGHTIKSVPHLELACVADVSPTAFYLEIEEGRNISLLCQIHAVPEALISWSFEGRILQNSSILEKETRLVYYDEKGKIDKQSELFIYNANSETNGTYTCSAENPAGISQANYTIRVLLKDNEVISAHEIPFEVILLVISGLVSAGVLFLLVIILSVIKCQRHCNLRHNKRPKQRNKKIPLLETKELTDESIVNMNIKLVQRKDTNSVRHNNVQLNQKCPKSVSNLQTTNQINPPPLETYQPERNPDLINGTESIHRMENDAIKENYTPFAHTVSRNVQECNLCVLGNDVRLNPIGLLNAGNRVITENCYRTLPCNRSGKRHTAAIPTGRLCKETDFLRKTGRRSFYQQYDSADVRYTADGYPAKERVSDSDSVCLSPAASNKSEGSTSTVVGTCCVARKSAWPQCVPGNFVKQESVLKKSVSAQTQTESDCSFKERSLDPERRGIVVALSHDNVQL